MRKIVQAIGFFLMLVGVSGTIDHLAYQPIMGVVFNSVNRFVIPNVDALRGYELAANLGVAAAGLLVFTGGALLKPAR